MYFFHSNQRKRDWSWMHPNPVNLNIESRYSFSYYHHNLKRITGGVIIQGFMPAKDIGQKSP
nr:MAG TPA: hypothetical protein [Caudoviricetes sp.]